MLLYDAMEGFMKVPFDYILINIMINLKERNMTPRISKNNLEKIITKFIKSYYTEIEALDIINNFDYEYELDYFYSEYLDYFSMDNDNIILDDDVSMKTLEKFIILESDVDKYLLEDVIDFLDSDLSIIELMGITIRKDIYNHLIKISRSLNKQYKDLNISRIQGNIGIEEKTIKKIKLLSVQEKLMFINMHYNLDTNEYYDLLLYSEDILDNEEYSCIPFNIPNSSFDEYVIYSNPFQRTIFFDNMSSDALTRYKLDYNIDKVSESNSEYFMRDYKFYLTYYYLLLEEIETITDNRIKVKLNKTKYNLMQAIDSIFDNTLFMNIDNSKFDDINIKYSYNELETRFFIDELLSYSDDMYSKDDSYIIKYFNIIKKIFIRTYYNLTKNEDIIQIIKNNKLYGINKISSNYFDDIVNTPKRRIK